jgi:hypothetical protein
MIVALKDLTGTRFGKLLVTARGPNTNQGRAQWLCACDCGNTKLIQAANLTRIRGTTRSCGCIQIESRKANGDKARQLRAHAYSRANMPAEHKTWENIKARCNNPLHVSYHAYGAKGVTVCDRWMESFKNFADDMGPRPAGYTIERKESALGYSPENCEWATRDAQANNKITSRHITAFGRTMTVAHWAAETGLTYGHIYYRVCIKGISAEEVLS